MSNSDVTIVQHKISDDKNDSYWYDGLIAFTGKYQLFARGEIKMMMVDEDGNYVGMYDGKARDNYKSPENDKDLEKVYACEGGYITDNNNWFEINVFDEPDFGLVVNNYDEGIERLIEMSSE
jgi:hypothetical protein